MKFTKQVIAGIAVVLGLLVYSIFLAELVEEIQKKKEQRVENVMDRKTDSLSKEEIRRLR